MTTGGATTSLAPAAGLGTRRAASAHDYWELLKPRIMLLIVITTIGYYGNASAVVMRAAP